MKPCQSSKVVSYSYRYIVNTYKICIFYHKKGKIFFSNSKRETGKTHLEFMEIIYQIIDREESIFESSIEG